MFLKIICYHFLVLHNNDMHCGCIGNKNWGQIDQIQFVKILELGQDSANRKWLLAPKANTPQG